MARPRTKVNASTRKRIVSRYTRSREGLVALAEAFKLSVAVIRRVLVEADVTLRGRGRPRKAG